VLDFTEIPEGEDFELLIRDMLLAMEYRVMWSGRGIDGGKDLLVEEPGDKIFGSKPRRWLVSCKHNARANDGNGRSVNTEDIGVEGGIVDALDHHGATGFVLACSTQPSSSVVERLTSIETRKGISTHYWDRATLQHWLNSPICWSIAQRYMPASAGESRVYARETPNRFVVVCKSHFIRLGNRYGSFVGFQLTWVEEHIEAIDSCALPDGFRIWLRGVYVNDRDIQRLTWYMDCLYEPADSAFALIDENLTEEDIQESIVSYFENYANEQFMDCIYQVNLRPVNRASDSYDPNHYSFYYDLPADV
jgi:hypothetical protein